MKFIHPYSQSLIIIFFALVLLAGCKNIQKHEPIKVLILSGKNTHEWSKTTPILIRMYNEARLFSTNVTEKPDTLTYKDLKKYDVVVSNWNNWPDNESRMNPEWESGFLRYVTEGGGSLYIHAGASSFYGWEDYHKIGIGRWGKETNHGQAAKAKVSGFDQTHPVTKGIKDFYITDELWENTDIHPDAKPLASIESINDTSRYTIRENAIFVNQTGRGRSFYTILGHDERALLNSGLQTILLRATLWAAQKEITLQTPLALSEKITDSDKNLYWEQSDTTISLNNDSGIIWQYNFNNRFGKSYFHPLNAKNSPLTCVSPPDHSWHHGLWFSWKFINEVNYWEYLDNFKTEETGYKSAGITRLNNIGISRNEDFSADIKMTILYHTPGNESVMEESRNLYTSKPFSDGSYFIDYSNTFKPLSDELILDRTPIEGEPGGQSWGGYSGLSVRFNQDYTSTKIIAPDETNSYKNNDWVYMGFNTLTGDTAGLCIMQNKEFTTSGMSWYVINDPLTPFYYYSPAVLYNEKIVLRKGETLKLKYRVWIFPDRIEKKEIQTKYDEYSEKEKILNNTL
jgi:type 1 glutamine amidotransferase